VSLSIVHTPAARNLQLQGANAGEFSDLTKEGRQALIDKVSPATN
jgi:hypothetical protein